MEATLRQTWAFLFRGYHITRRYIGWVIVFNFYALVTSATVALIGVRREKLSTHSDARGRCVVVELSVVALQRDRDVDRLRTLGRDARIHVHGAGVTRGALARRQSVFAAEQHRDEHHRARWSDAVHGSELARRKFVWRVRCARGEHGCFCRSGIVCSGVSGDER